METVRCLYLLLSPVVVVVVPVQVPVPVGVVVVVVVAATEISGLQTTLSREHARMIRD